MKRVLLPGILCGLLGLMISEVQADVKLPKIIDSHMVLQRDMPVPIWGWAAPDEEVTVEFSGQKATTKADAKGDWKVTLPSMKSDGKAHKMLISGKNKITLNNILIGEVWLGSGQSNMEWTVAGSMDAKKTIAAANHPNIRLFHVPRVQVSKPAKDVKATWAACTPKSVHKFSGVLYFFGLKLQKELGVPIGLINSSWGGSAIEPWMIEAKTSGGMYNGMIAPVKPFALRGITWYQGETNVFHKNGMKYFDKKKALIEAWRKVWGIDLAFYFVQIAPWEGTYPANELQALWEAQVACLKIPGTGMAVTTDLVDNIKDIHPRNKQDVGHRLALWALAKNYGKKDLVYSGPLYKQMKVADGKIILSFAHAKGGLKSRDGKPLTEFEIAGADNKFVPATATIQGKKVVVEAKGVANPTQVRFGWSHKANPNLTNTAGLPASPFRTANWQGGTGK